MLLTVGTRGSRLSLVQTELVVESIRQKNPGLKIDRKVITTAGDADQRTPLFSLDQKGIFEKEIDQAVLDGQVDFAVHSMKDIPVFDKDSGLLIASVPERGSVADVLVSTGNGLLKDMKNGSRIGTSSLLRVAQLRRARPDVKPEPIRGNVDTRIQKVERGEFDAVVLAEAGLVRLGLTGRISERLSIEDFMPAPGQGALAVVARRDDLEVIEMLKSIEHPPTRAEIEAERELVRILEGGCKVPVGALARARGNRIQIAASIFSMDGKVKLLAERSGHVLDAVVLAREMGEELLEKGAKRIEETWRTVYV
ncbi:hydroxymethylbilane synthase [Candidatus Bathyarchaeota archaeon]|nr:MAG: hydroxymethylbilane synthase [Candidatus Bathyarchaeota archaeon]TMI51769.1 MAG: hydroxymethylbilane synthase [Candidatus Bathyarchaeota archaeon]